MNKKIIWIFVCMLMFINVLTVVGINNRIEKNKIISFNNDTYMKFAPGEFIIKLKKDATFSKSSFKILNEKYQVYSIEEIFPNSEGSILDNIYLVHVPIRFDILYVVEEYISCHDVVYAEPNGIAYLCGIPNDANFNNQWYLHNTGQFIFNWDGIDYYGTPDADIDAPEAWEIEMGSSDVVIALIDTGINYMHPDLAANIWNNIDEIPVNGIDDDNNGYIDDIRGWDFYFDDNDPKDERGHGTMCAGVVDAVGNNCVGIAGVANNCKIMPLKVFNESENTNVDIIAQGIKYAADNGANVISMSFAYNGKLIKEVCNYAYGKGVFLCAAAGNYNSDIEFYPAAFENVTAVAATNQNDKRCSPDDWGLGMGSCYGDWVDIAAPGNLIYTTMPTYHVTYNDRINFYTGKYFSKNYECYAGTSLACPQVAGVAALLLSREPSLTPDEIKTLICENADPYDSTEYIGAGRLNANKALMALIADNVAPDKLTITGESWGKPNLEYNSTLKATDPENDDISFFIDWGDNTSTNWTGFLPSGVNYTYTHTWSQKGNFIIKAKVKDFYAAESDWVKFNVSIAKSKVKNIPLLLQKFLQCFPFFEKILNQL